MAIRLTALCWGWQSKKQRGCLVPFSHSYIAVLNSPLLQLFIGEKGTPTIWLIYCFCYRGSNAILTNRRHTKIQERAQLLQRMLYCLSLALYGSGDTHSSTLHTSTVRAYSLPCCGCPWAQSHLHSYRVDMDQRWRYDRLANCPLLFTSNLRPIFVQTMGWKSVCFFFHLKALIKQTKTNHIIQKRLYSPWNLTYLYLILYTKSLLTPAEGQDRGESICKLSNGPGCKYYPLTRPFLCSC